MALANAGWDDYSFGRAASASRRPRRGVSFGLLVAGAVVAAGLFAGLSEWRAMENAAPAVSTVVRPGPAGGRTARLLAPVVSPFERSAERFLRDSLPLTQPCRADCAQAPADLEEAELSGRFGPPGIATTPANAPLTTGLPMQAQFGPAALPSPDVASPKVAAAAPPPAPAPVRIAPAVVVPLPPVFFAPAAPTAPLPAARPERSPGESVAIASSSPLKEEAAPPVTGRMQAPVAAPSFGRNSGVAVYDISAAVVYMPDGERLEAHSGLGSMVDNPRYVDRIDTGPTPPNVYNLIMRKGRFHGVEALRLIPANGNNRFGRVGLLAHTYLLRGRPAESNGCVAFKDYSRFLNAFKRGQITRLVVVPSLSGSSLRIASAGNI